MLSPVDGVDPYGIVQDYCITPGEKLNFETPTLIMTSGLDGIPGISNTGGLVPPCAPDELANMRFWDALNGKAWFNNATLFGHVDFLDPGAVIDVIEVNSKVHTPKTLINDFPCSFYISALQMVITNWTNCSGCLSLDKLCRFSQVLSLFLSLKIVFCLHF